MLTDTPVRLLLLLALAGCGDIGAPEEDLAEDGPVRAILFTGPPEAPEADWFVARVEPFGDDYLLDDDILFPASRVELLADGDEPERYETQGTVRISSDHRWPNATMPIEVPSDIPDRDRIWWATDLLQQISAVRIPVRSNQGDWVRIRLAPSDVCNSPVGRMGGRQDVNLGFYCDRDATLHELMHALGFFHEQNRYDRDTFVTIRWENIEPGHEHNFEKLPDREGALYTPYDFESLMHYQSYAFSSNGQPTIVRKDDPSRTIYDATLPSRGDIRTLYRVYGHRVTYPIDGRVCGGAARWVQPKFPVGTNLEHPRQVARLYCAAFDRLPDDGGAQYWVSQLRQGKSLQSIADYFAGSPEFRNRYGTVNIADFTVLMYRLVMDRDPDADGHAYWVYHQMIGLVTRGIMLLSFSESPEYKNRTGGII